MGRRCVAPYSTRPTRPLEHSHYRANPPRTVRVHCEHLLMWSQCTGRTRRSGRSVCTGNPPRTVRERYARRVKLSVCTRPLTVLLSVHVIFRGQSAYGARRRSATCLQFFFGNSGNVNCCTFINAFIHGNMRLARQRQKH